MTDEGTRLAVAAILETVMAMQSEMAAMNARQVEILDRLNQIDAGLAATTDLVPMLEIILARLIEDRERQAEGFERTAELAAFAHAAASGQGEPLPDELADHALLKRFAYLQTAEREPIDPALARWRQEVKRASTEELTKVLKAQYMPSPTEPVDVRVLRFRLAAITRDELKVRGAVLPPARPPAIVRDHSVMSKQARIAELAALWRVGDSLALHGDAELAGAIDYMGRTRARLLAEGNSPDLVDDLMAQLHEKIGDEMAGGQVVKRQTAPGYDAPDRENGKDSELGAARETDPNIR
ncbi:hypothetical protein HT136_24950 [Novosphingobium profundi]|uniref:hypothetical protein n=1 Tax=Novosphingobium TaxID=165696 RepID=UPI000572F776|nr:MULTISPECIES: hypothetical protein [Novosphingobium]MBT0671622.1 hypothetical protein [Novosphingobium profundi]GAM07468.1 hypothetical conserved protein [Novosphingobium sp. MBES04]